MLKNLVNIIETRVNGMYILEDSGVNYIYDEKTNDLHEANNLVVDYLKPKSKYESSNYEIDNWKAW